MTAFVLLYLLVIKDYPALADTINKTYPTIYNATANIAGVVVVMLMQASLPHAANFLQGCSFIKGKNLIVSAIVEDGLICIQ